MAASMESRLVVDALEMAIRRRRPDAGLLAHSDRGSQYASEHYQRVLSAAGIVCSMSGVGQCWDNAPMESFFGRMKCEVESAEMFAGVLARWRSESRKEHPEIPELSPLRALIVITGINEVICMTVHRDGVAAVAERADELVEHSVSLLTAASSPGE